MHICFFLTISFSSVASYDFLNNWYTFMMSIVHVLKKDFSLWIYHCSKPCECLGLLLSGEQRVDLFSRVKKMEERILYLESLSPEYFRGGIVSTTRAAHAWL